MKKERKKKYNLDDWDLEIDIPPNEPIYTPAIICRILHMRYWDLYELMRSGIVKPKKISKKKKLFSYKDIKKIKYVYYLMHKRGVNINGIKVIMEMNPDAFDI